jgi:hypothetical protein
MTGVNLFAVLFFIQLPVGLFLLDIDSQKRQAHLRLQKTWFDRHIKLTYFFGLLYCVAIFSLDVSRRSSLDDASLTLLVLAMAYFLPIALTYWYVKRTRRSLDYLSLPVFLSWLGGLIVLLLPATPATADSGTAKDSTPSTPEKINALYRKEDIGLRKATSIDELVNDLMKGYESRHSFKHGAGLRRVPEEGRGAVDAAREGEIRPPYTPSAHRELLNKRYEVVTKGWKTGGMAVVHLARDIKTGSLCVIKVPRLNTANPYKLNVEKLQVEADFLRNSRHPNIVRFVDQFIENGVFHLVEEWIDGTDVLTAFARNTADEPRVKKWAVQILDALDYIHRSGMVHRDLNPKNLMLTRDDNIILLDFGTVKKAGESDPAVTIFTTRGFAAPETLRGFTDERSDIYGVGSILLYMLTSQRIGNLGKRDLVELLSSRGISQRTSKCIAQALQIDPEFRFQTAASMRRAISGDEDEGKLQK